MQAMNAVGNSWNKRARTLMLCALIALAAGCKVSAEDIDYWKGTVKGPGKITAVMLADKYPMELRTQAALALVQMDRTDRDGTADLQQALAQLDEASRSEVVSGMVPGLTAQMNEKDPKAEGGAPSTKQNRAKDAAFVLIPYAAPEAKAKLTQAVVGWYVQDFNGRSLAGNFSAEQVVRALGSPAAKELVGGLQARLPQQALVKLAQLIGQTADPATKKEAAERLVAIEQEMESSEFLNWISQTIAAQAAQTQKKLDPAKLKAAAEINRDNFINDGAIPAMKWLADEPPVKKRLLSLASTPSKTDENRRVRALQALEGKVDRNDLQQVLALALDNNNPKTVRDYAFDRVGDIKSPEALPSLWPLVTGSEDQRLRWRAGEMILAIGGPQVVDELFTKLPSGGDYPPEELEGYATRMGQMSPLPSAQARRLLESSNWYARVTAVHFFERKGTQDDVKKLDAVKADKASVKGPRWGKTKTVGEVADEAAESAKQRLSQAGVQ
jgi:hypothetical protein